MVAEKKINLACWFIPVWILVFNIRSSIMIVSEDRLPRNLDLRERK